jgi:hypothetical protein
MQAWRRDGHHRPLLGGRRPTPFTVSAAWTIATAPPQDDFAVRNRGAFESREHPESRSGEAHDWYYAQAFVASQGDICRGAVLS